MLNDPGVKVAPLFVQLPEILILLAVPAVKVPAVRIKSPLILTVNVAGIVKLPVVCVKLVTLRVAILPPGVNV